MKGTAYCISTIGDAFIIFFFKSMDLRGIEPLSESLFIKASPITANSLTFPPLHAKWQAYSFSSFIIRLQAQSFACNVSHIVGARFLKCECSKADEQQLGC